MTKVKKPCSGEKTAFSTNGAGAFGLPQAILTPYMKLNSKRITDLNIKHKTFRKKIRRNL